MEKEDQAHDIRPRYKGVCEACQGDLYTCKIIAQAAEPYIPGHETRQDCGFIRVAQIYFRNFVQDAY